jgi:hypothetical protein
MKESYGEGVATHTGSKSCEAAREGGIEALTGVRAGRVFSGQGTPEMFNLLGFTHICGKKRSNGPFTVVRQTIRKRLQAKLGEVKAELRRRMHDSIPEVGKCAKARATAPPIAPPAP